MTTDEVKDYLRQAYKLDRRLQREQMKLEKLRSAIEYRSPSFEGAGGHGSGDKMSAAVTSIIEHGKRVDELTALYIMRYKEIDDAIHTMDDDILVEVLERRYLLYQKWEEIADSMNYTVRHITRLHGQALKKMSLNVHIQV